MIRRLLRHDGGAAAVEFAFVLPIIVAVLLLGVDGWLRLSQARDMSGALQTAARYYPNGGSDDDAAKALGLAAWGTAPSGATLTVSRACTCSGASSSCTASCGNGSAPQTLITLSAQSTFSSLTGGSSQLSRQEVLRVR